MLNNKIIQLTKSLNIEVRDIAPSTFPELMAQASVNNKLVVWSGSSEKTIYGNPRINWLFRAWHDSLHVRLNAPFTLEGETLVALEQARLMGCNAVMGDIIMAEIVGQAEYFQRMGEFPADQMAFINDYLKAA